MIEVEGTVERIISQSGKWFYGGKAFRKRQE